jgi:hypothetical protein
VADRPGADAPISIAEAVRDLLTIVRRLRDSYSEHGRHFTLDGRLIGDIGEVLAVQHYAITLTTTQTAVHDAVTADGRKVQIKATMKDSLTFPWGDAPDYYIGLKILEDGTPLEVYNGPGALIKIKALAGRKSRPKTGNHVVSSTALCELNQGVADIDRVLPPVGGKWPERMRPRGTPSRKAGA